MRKLTLKEEIQILDYALNKKSSQNGSSRIVIPFGRNHVIKIGVGEAGKLQNYNEIDLYLEIKHTGQLADIKAYV